MVVNTEWSISPAVPLLCFAHSKKPSLHFQTALNSVGYLTCFLSTCVWEICSQSLKSPHVLLLPQQVANGGQMENKINLPVPVYLRPLDQTDASMKVLYSWKKSCSPRYMWLLVRVLEFWGNEIIIMWFIYNGNVIIMYSLCLSQLWCAAGVNLSGGRISDLPKQTKGSQISLDQLEQENKVRVSTL